MTRPSAAPTIVVLDGLSEDLDGRSPVLAQQPAASRVLIRKGPNKPGFIATHSWNRVLDEPHALVWLSDGHDGVTPGFLSAATAALDQKPQAAFAVATPAGTRLRGTLEPAHSTLVSALSGRGLGAAMLLRVSALRAVGGVDEGTDSAVTAQWDLAIRLAEAGHEPVAVPAMAPNAQATSYRAGEEVVRALYRKHARLYERHLREVLLDREVSVGELLRENHLAENVIEDELRPRLRARRRERDRLGAKLRRSAGERQHARNGDADGWSDLRRLEPLSPFQGRERGQCIELHYIERFLQRHAADIHGSVLEYRTAPHYRDVLGSRDSPYAARYGGSGLEQLDVVDIHSPDAEAHIAADPQLASHFPTERYDCVILPHILQLIDDPAAAVAECIRVLKPGGVLLAIVPSAARARSEGQSTDRWRFSPSGLAELVAGAFRPANVEVQVQARGNGKVVIAALVGLAAEELASSELERTDPNTPLVALVRAVKPGRQAR